MVANDERKSTKTKIEQRGKVAMFVGYAEDHTGDVYRFIHPKTQHVILSRCKMDEHYAERIYEKTKTYQPWATDNR